MKIVNIVLALLLVAGLVIIGNNVGYYSGYRDGSNWALDTVNHLLGKQVDSDTTVTEISIKGSKPDTLSYFLSAKILFDSEKNKP